MRTFTTPQGLRWTADEYFRQQIQKFRPKLMEGVNFNNTNALLVRKQRIEHEKAQPKFTIECMLGFFQMSKEEWEELKKEREYKFLCKKIEERLRKRREYEFGGERNDDLKYRNTSRARTAA